MTNRRYRSYTEEIEANNEALRYMEWEERYRPSTGDPRTPLQRRLDGLSLAEAWNWKTEHDLRMKVEVARSVGYEDEESREAERSLMIGSYRAENPYRDGGDAIIVGDFVLDEYELLTKFEGWYSDGYPRFTTVGYKKSLEEALKITGGENRRLFGKAGKKYSEIGERGVNISFVQVRLNHEDKETA